MSRARPFVIFVRGPRAGRAAPLRGREGVIGRGGQATVRAQDDTVSRRHVRYTRGDEGWVFECLSDRGMRVNGKKYKPGQKLLLDSGDLLGIGVETELVFAGPADTPQRVLDAFLAENPDYEAYLKPDEAPAESEAEGPDAAEAEPEPEPGEPVSDGDEADQETAPTLADEEEAARRAKIRKYGVFFVIWLALLGVLVIWLATRNADEPTVAGQRLRHLPNDEIKHILEERLQRPHEPAAARRQLARAQHLYERYRNVEPAQRDRVLFQCFYAYKLHLAFAHKADLDDPADLRHRTEVREKLLERITSLYDTGYTRFQNKDWRGARDAYGTLLRMIPKGEHEAPDDPVYAELRENISRYHAYVSGKMAEQDKTW